SAEDSAAIRLFVEQSHTHTSLAAVDRPLVELGCVACHARGPHEGIEGVLPQVIAHDPKLAPLLPAMAPPSLEDIGDKLEDAALEKAIAQVPRRRPWLAIRMPRFPLDDAE